MMKAFSAFHHSVPCEMRTATTWRLGVERHPGVIRQP
jgi:hypothetical protein